jgi:hypothetical protein
MRLGLSNAECLPGYDITNWMHPSSPFYPFIQYKYSTEDAKTSSPSPHSIFSLHFLSKMKLLASIFTLTSVAHAHYTFPSLVSGGTTTSPWQSVRQWTGYYTNNPVTSVTSPDIRCNVNGASISAAGTLSVAAGSSLGFTADPNIYHPGPALVYLAKVPSGKTAATWDGSGAVWFKIYQVGPIFGGQALSWATDSMFAIPSLL